MVDPEKEPELAGRWYQAKIKRVEPSHTAATVEFFELLDDDEFSPLCEDHGIQRMRPKPPDCNQALHVEWLAALSQDSPCEVRYIRYLRYRTRLARCAAPRATGGDARGVGGCLKRRWPSLAASLPSSRTTRVA